MYIQAQNLSGKFESFWLYQYWKANLET